MSEETPEIENDPDVQEALQEESELLTREMERMKVQHFEQRLIAVNVENRKLKRRIAELEALAVYDVEADSEGSGD